MKNIEETLQQKEQELKRLEKEIAVLRAAVSILAGSEGGNDSTFLNRATADTSPAYSSAGRLPERAINDAIPNTSPYPTFARNADMIEQIRPESMADRPKRSFP